MANEDLKVITKAKQLAKHTLIVTSNADDTRRNTGFLLWIRYKTKPWKYMKYFLKLTEQT